jgi:hypothetical protein
VIRFPGRRLHLALIAALVACGASGWLRADLRAGGAAPRTSSPVVAVPAPVESLPLNLAPPLEPGTRLVALVASDIDADGDLDLVANDGSLDLLVWINDGTGHLTRRYAQQHRGWRDDAPGANGNGQPSPVSAVGSSSASVAPARLQISGAGPRASRPVYESVALSSWFARSQHPRAPPSSHLSL